LRLTFERAGEPAGGAITGRDYAALWESALGASGLPVARTDAGRLRFSIAAPLPAGATGRAELADVWLTERRPVWGVRERIERGIPAGHRLIGLEDVWLGAPSLVGRVAAADYEVTLAAVDLATTRLAAAASELLAADRLPRERSKGGGTKSYDLRPLLLDLDIAAKPANHPVIRMRTRIHPELGSGRPDEVVAALGDALGAGLKITSISRLGLVLADDLDG
jgi:radical SAM-linked protein